MKLENIIEQISEFQNKKSTYSIAYCEQIEEGLTGLLLRHPKLRKVYDQEGNIFKLDLPEGIYIRYQGKFINTIKIEIRENFKILTFGHQNEYLEIDEDNYYDLKRLYYALMIVFQNTDLIEEYKELGEIAKKTAEQTSKTKEEILTDGDPKLNSHIHSFFYNALINNQFYRRNDTDVEKRTYYIMLPEGICIKCKNKKYNSIIIEDEEKWYGKISLGYTVQNCYMFEDEIRYTSDEYTYDYNKIGPRKTDYTLLHKDEFMDFAVNPYETINILKAIEIITTTYPLEEMWMSSDENMSNPKNL